MKQACDLWSPEKEVDRDEMYCRKLHFWLGKDEEGMQLAEALQDLSGSMGLACIAELLCVQFSKFMFSHRMQSTAVT